jgi:hypothetical protein
LTPVAIIKPCLICLTSCLLFLTKGHRDIYENIYNYMMLTIGTHLV